MVSLDKNETWDLLALLNWINLIGSKWVFKNVKYLATHGLAMLLQIKHFKIDFEFLMEFN